MLSLDFLIAVTYVAALMVTKKIEYFYCFMFFASTIVIATATKDWFTASKGGIECLYFLSMCSIWLFLASYLSNKNIKISITLIAVSIYEFSAAIESFIWQFISPAFITPVIENYAFNVLAMHMIIIMSIYRWGVKIAERDTRHFINNFNAAINRQHLR